MAKRPAGEPPKSKGAKTLRKKAKLPPGAHNVKPLAPIEIVPPNRRGAPTDYQPEYASQAAHLCALGATDSDLARAFDVTPETIQDWRARHEKFSLALKAGKEAADERVERSLYMNAVGYEYEVVEPIVVGKQIIDHPSTKRVLPNTTAQIFWLKNRRKHLWRDVHQHEVGQPGEFDNLTDMQIAQEMARAAENIAKLESAVARGAKKNGNGKMN